MRHRVLVVEDDAAVLEAIQLMLRNDYEVIVATNGKDAVKLYQAYKPDIVLMDINLPEMDGVMATREIIKIDPNAKIIGISAYAKRRGEELLKAGAKEVIEKPFSKSKLLETVRRYLDGSGASEG